MSTTLFNPSTGTDNIRLPAPLVLKWLQTAPAASLEAVE